MLETGAPVYKLVGPVLVDVELDEARENVKKRLEFIEAEIQKLDNSIGERHCPTHTFNFNWCLICVLF